MLWTIKPGIAGLKSREGTGQTDRPQLLGSKISSIPFQELHQEIENSNIR